MHAPDCLRGLGHKKSCDGLGERILLDQQAHEVAAWQVLHHHVQMRFVDEAVVQGRQPLVLVGCLGQCFSLRSHVVDLILDDHHFLLHAFECINLPRSWIVRLPLLSHQTHFTEGTAPDDCQRFEICRRDLFPRFLGNQHLFSFEGAAEILLLLLGQPDHLPFQMHFSRGSGFLLPFQPDVALRQQRLGPVGLFLHFLIRRRDGIIVDCVRCRHRPQCFQLLEWRGMWC
mmetsp:Transcript_5772/g.17157  ORF Transcript_5772/g.17157 Transcript_5772/m.17157 type:complete len:229 (-) Transcript_5772:978-1664(-)